MYLYQVHVNTKYQHNQVAMHLMNLIGQVEEVKSEKSIDTFTGLFGSGPAYLYLLIEIWSNYAKKNGFKYAEEMTVQTILGSILLLLHTQEKPESLRQRVTSKGGTTEAALMELNNNQKFQKLFENLPKKLLNVSPETFEFRDGYANTASPPPVHGSPRPNSFLA